MRDLNQIVGDELDTAERERLGRVHALLEQAGPPPELSPALARAPEPPAARVIPFPWRYRSTVLAAAAVAALALFGLGYLAGGGGGQDPVRTVAMTGTAPASATLDLFAQDAAGNWPMELRVSGLPAGLYELWLTRGDELAEPCGSFAVADGETTVPLNAPYGLRDFDGWVVVPAGETTPVLTT
ncbi:MAG: hypothetical protein M5U27_14740 [Gaiella sp.]|nr:hypothetical protein [Gaiella sp.]